MSLKMLDGNDLPHELLLTTRQKTKLRNAFNNNMSTDLTLSKSQISKIIQSGGLLGLLLSKLAGPLMKVAIPLAKNLLAPLGITGAASAIAERIKKKTHGSGRSLSTTLIILKKEMNDIMEVVQAFGDSNVSLEGVIKIFKNESKEQKGGFLSMLLGPSLLGNILAGKGIVRAGCGNKKGKGIVMAGLWKRVGFLMLSHPLTNFEIQKYYQNEPGFIGI